GERWNLSASHPHETEQRVYDTTGAVAGRSRAGQLIGRAQDRSGDNECDPLTAAQYSLDCAAKMPQPVDVECQVPRRNVDESGGQKRPVAAVPDAGRGQIAPPLKAIPRSSRSV